jgi:hypothetical protein
MALFKNLVAGTVGGAAGAFAMLSGVTMGKELQLIEKALPQQVEQRLAQRAGVADELNRTEEQALSRGGHLVLGAAFGAGYGLLQTFFDLPPRIAGPLYGLGVYMVNLAGIGPALGLVSRPSEQEPMTVGRRIMMHIVYGSVTANVAERVQEFLA